MKQLFLLAIIFVFAFPILAQDMVMESVSISASDDHTLVGDIYFPDSDGSAPAVLLMHMLGGRPSDYDPFIPALVDAGYVILNIDIRGHGETGGSSDWDLATADIQSWLDWLREQDGVRDDAVSIIGASIGSNLALIGCANDASCLTAIALSPGTDYRGVQPEDSVVEGLANRSVLLVASHQDSYSADSVKQMFSNATGNISARLYEGRAHGTQFFNTEAGLESITALSISWLDEQVAALDNE